MFLKRWSLGRLLAGMSFILALAVAVSGDEKKLPPDSTAPKTYLEFNGQRFYLAFEDANANRALYEYLAKDGKIDHWRELMTVMCFPNFPKEIGVEGYLKSMEKRLETVNPPAVYEIVKDKTSGQTVLVFIVSQKQAKEVIVESNIMRFRYDDALGLLVYQYAKRQYVPNPDNVTVVVREALQDWKNEAIKPFLNADFIVHAEEATSAQ